MDTIVTTRAVAGTPRLLLRLEGLALFAVATAVFQVCSGLSWWIYAALFFAPDLSFAAYVMGPSPGALAYNALHSTIGPVLLGLAGLTVGSSILFGIAAIWAAHIGFDRVLGYGLKYSSSFGDTHLGPIGRNRAGA